MSKKPADKRKAFKAPVNTKTGEEGDRAISTKSAGKGKKPSKFDEKPSKSDAAENPKAVAGDNSAASARTEDQQRVIFFDHLKRVKKAAAVVADCEVELRAARKDLGDIKKMVKAEGTLLVDIDTAIRLEEGDAKVIQGEIENQVKVARWLNIPFGYQFDLLDRDERPATDKANEEGKIAGLKGLPKKPPHDPSVPQYKSWMEGYGEGQMVLGQKFKAPPTPKPTSGTAPPAADADKPKPPAPPAPPSGDQSKDTSETNVVPLKGAQA